ncbi:hypothetical protein EV661_2613 [Variibacter gotjawalensis]|nr:hypothetical protein EV661_2613 [Variibacter gotjawalensis]
MLLLSRRSFVSLMSYRFARLIAVVALPLLVAACGVKGPLESPLQAQLDEEKRATAEPLPQASQPVYGSRAPGAVGAKVGRDLPKNQSTTGAGTQSGAVINAPAARQSSPLDFLIN